MNELLASNYSLWLFFIIAGTIGWATSHLKSRLLKSFSHMSLALVDSGLTFVALLLYSLITSGRHNGILESMKDLSRLSGRDVAYLFALALYGAGAGLIASALLKRHGTVDFALTGILVSIGAAAVGVWWLAKDGVTWKRGVGLLLLAAGGALTM